MRRVCSSSVIVLVVWVSATTVTAGPILTVNPDLGTLSTDGSTWVSSLVWNGTTIKAGGIGADGVRQYMVYGDFNVGATDVVTAQLGTLSGVRFVVGNNANLAGTFSFSALGRQGRAGGGLGGGVGAGGTGVTANGGAGGAGGAPGLQRVRWYTDVPLGYGGAGGAAGLWSHWAAEAGSPGSIDGGAYGAVGSGGGSRTGSVGPRGGDGQPGLNNSVTIVGGSGGSGGAGGPTGGGGAQTIIYSSPGDYDWTVRAGGAGGAHSGTGGAAGSTPYGGGAGVRGTQYLSIDRSLPS